MDIDNKSSVTPNSRILLCGTDIYANKEYPHLMLFADQSLSTLIQ